jgi:protein TonB
MFSNVTSMVRLLLCLLLSLGVHAGVVFVEWSRGPAESVAVLNVVEVSLVTASAAERSEVAATRPAPPATPPERSPRQPVAKSSPPRTRPSEKQVAVPEKLSPAESAPVEIAQAIAIPTWSPEIFPSVDLACKASKARQAPPDSTTVPEVVTSAEPVRQVGGRPAAVAASVAEVVDAEPRYRSNPLPKYPYLARQRHWEGRVWLLVTVSTEGRVVDLRVAESSGYGVLDKSALKTVRRWSFSPATRVGIPVESQVKVPVEFRLED